MRILIIILGVIAMSCSPRLSTPEVQLADNYNSSAEWVSSVEVDSLWWQTIDDRVLAALVEKALNRNLTLQMAQLTVSEARYNLRVARSGYIPDLSLELSAERLREDGVYESEYEVVPAASWQIPLFGALRSTSQIATAQVAGAEWESRGTALTIASEVAKAYYSILEYRSSLDVAMRSSQLREQATALVDSMHYHGMSSGVDLSQAKALAATAKGDVAKYSLALDLSERSLALLLSCSADSIDFSAISSNIYTLSSPQSVPVGVPSDLLYNRPDLRQAYFDVQEAMGEVGLARSAQFPSISLTVDGGAYSTSLKGLTLSKLLTCEWAVDLVAPIF
ncbi:MAG: TolC family protein, partial [Rikenellaceae bacterium]